MRQSGKLYAALGMFLLTSLAFACRSNDSRSVPKTQKVRLSSTMPTETESDEEQSVIPAIADTEAELVAKAMFEGIVERTISYVDDRSKRRIAVMVQENRASPHDIYVIEPFAKNYRVIWEKRDCCGEMGDPAKSLLVEDADGDAIHEVAYIEESAGSMSSYTELTLEVISSGKTFSLAVTDDTGVEALQIELSPNLEDKSNKVFRDWIEAKAIELEVIKPLNTKRADLDLSENAEKRWKQENGDLIEGKVSIHWYDGLAAELYKRSIVAETVLNGRHYLSTLKGATYCDDPQNKRHYVVFVPADSYNWVAELGSYGDFVSMTLHNTEKTIYFNPMTMTLRTTREEVHLAPPLSSR